MTKTTPKTASVRDLADAVLTPAVWLVVLAGVLTLTGRKPDEIAGLLALLTPYFVQNQRLKRIDKNVNGELDRRIRAIMQDVMAKQVIRVVPSPRSSGTPTTDSRPSARPRTTKAAPADPGV